MTKGTKPKEYYRDQNGMHPVFAVKDIIDADEIKDTHIDFGTGAGQVSAGDIPSADAGGRYTAEEVDGQLQEIAGAGRTTETVKGNADAIAAKVPTSRQIIAGTGLSGGGDLSADRTMSISPQILHVRDEKSSGTDGGTFTSGAWRTRDLNTVVKNTIPGASLASNQITLPAGTYRIRARAPGNKVDRHKAAIYNDTSSTYLIYGSNSYSISTGEYAQTDSVVEGWITLASESVLELRHYCQKTIATDGFGIDTTFGVVEVYSEVIIEKVG